MHHLSPSLGQRAFHQFRAELRRERWLLLVWWIVLAFRAVETWDFKEQYPADYMPGFLPVILGVVLIIRLVRADHPGSPDTASLTRPIGRGALWLGKAAVALLFGLLPWAVARAVWWRGYDLTGLQWLGAMIIILLPCLAIAGAAGWLASLGTKKPAVIALSVIAGSVVLLPLVASSAPYFSELVLKSSFRPFEKLKDSVFDPTDLNRCRSVIALGTLVLALWLVWWRSSMGDRPRSLATIASSGLLLMVAAHQFWVWNWRALPAQKYAGLPLQLHTGIHPDVGSQTLWRGLHLRGLARDQIASVVAVAPVRPGEKKWPPRKAYSDFTYFEKTGEMQTPWRWMTATYARHLSEAFPPTTIWIGEQDNDREALGDIVKAEMKRSPIPEGTRWRLRLSICSLTRLYEAPLHDVLHQRIQMSPRPGVQLDLVHAVFGSTDIRIESFLRQRMPLVVPNSSFARLHPMGMTPTANLFFTIWSPMLGEGVCLHEGWQQWQYLETFWQTEYHRPISFNISLPVIHREIEGLKTSDWIKDSRFAIWWPEERGTIDLEVSAAQLKQAAQLP